MERHDAPDIRTVTYAQRIEARRLLGIQQSDPVKYTGANHCFISSFEANGHMPLFETGRGDRVAHLKAFFEAAGVEFTSDLPTGVRLRSVGS